ncbi:MAG: hypothetical protein ABI042_16415 [Verrucomicrobiota bacterium]
MKNRISNQGCGASGQTNLNRATIAAGAQASRLRVERVTSEIETRRRDACAPMLLAVWCCAFIFSGEISTRAEEQRKNNSSENSRDATPIRLGVGPHLFIDDFLIESSTNIQRVLNSPLRDPSLPNPVVTGPEDKNFQPFFTVVRDAVTKRFRIWYGVPAKPLGGSPSRLAYMESDDGIHWQRPHRVLENPGGLEVRFGASVIDEGPNFPDLTRRFKFGWNWGNFKAAAPVASDAGLMIAVSPDGFNWTPLLTNAPVLPHNHDINNIFYDPIRKRYLATVSNLVPTSDGKGKRRQPSQSFSSDLVHWSEPWPVIVPDAQDEGGDQYQYYAMSGYLARGGLLIGFAKVLRDDLPANPGENVGGIGYSILTWSRDGVHWQRDRTPFLPRNPASNTWDHAMSWIDCQLPVGDETFIYYGGYARGHKVERWTERQIGLVKMPRDRYVAREASAEKGMITTPLVELGGKTLTLNINARGGEVRVQIVDRKNKPIKGFAFADCEVIERNGVSERVRWKKHSDLSSLADKPLKLQFQMRAAKLYAFQIGE